MRWIWYAIMGGKKRVRFVLGWVEKGCLEWIWYYVLVPQVVDRERWIRWYYVLPQVVERERWIRGG